MGDWEGNTSLTLYYFIHYSFRESHYIIRNQVTRMDQMFRLAQAFNQPIQSWNTGKVIHHCTCITSYIILFENLIILFVIRSPAWSTCSILLRTSTKIFARGARITMQAPSTNSCLRPLLVPINKNRRRTKGPVTFGRERYSYERYAFVGVTLIRTLQSGTLLARTLRQGTLRVRDRKSVV